MARVVARRAHAPAGLFPDSRNTRFAGSSGEPLRPKGVHPLTLCFRVRLRVQIHFRRCRRGGLRVEEPSMLNEQQTLSLLGWTLGSVCLGTLVLSALALH